MTYEVLDNQTFRLDRSGERELMANFDARITEEVRYVDGNKTETFLKIDATMPPDEPGPEAKPVALAQATIDATAFGGLNWIMSAWGVRAIVQPGPGIKEDLRTAIQARSKPTVTTIYRHTGWAQIKGQPKFLHAAGAIGKTGNDASVQVQLPFELSKYSLATADKDKLSEAIQATLRLTDIGPIGLGWSLLAATICPTLCAADFCIHISGRTGTFKSEIASLFQSFYGQEMDARHLPGSWSSTANALEAQAFLAKNALFTIDDFVPTGTAWQTRAYQTTADKIVRSQGNQSGRARLTDMSNLQTAMYPRGLILSTGEDVPQGHSCRARMFILELSPDDVSVTDLTAAQEKRPLYSIAMSAWLQWLAGKPDTGTTERCKDLRKTHAGIGHTRTPSTIAQLISAIESYMRFAGELLMLSAKTVTAAIAEATKSILQVAENQSQYLDSADPADVFIQTLKNVFAAGLGHLRTINGGIPSIALQVGWTVEDNMTDIPTYKSHGPTLGWVASDKKEFYIDMAAGLTIIKKAAGTEIPLTKQTLLKRLKDAGLITRTEDARQRNTIRLMAEKNSRSVIALNLAALTQDEK